MAKNHEYTTKRDVWLKIDPQNVGQTDQVVANSAWYYENFAQSSVKTPGFHQLKPWQLPENPFYQGLRTDQYAYGTALYLDKYQGVERTWTYRCPMSYLYADIYCLNDRYPEEDPSNLAIAKLQGDVSSSAGNAMVTLAEADKTAKMVANSATKIAKAIGSLRKGRLGDFMQNLGMTTSGSEVRAYRNRWRRKAAQQSDMRQFAANSWLEYSYGWKPLLSDIYAQAQNLAEVLTQHHYEIHERRGSAKTRRVYDETIGTGLPIWMNKKTVIVESKVVYIVRYRIPDGGSSVANTFGLVNPLEVAWELIPFSFVADWFIPIGNFLAGLTAYNGLEFSSGVRVGQRKAVARCDTSPGPGRMNGSFRERAVFGGYRSEAHMHEIKRTVLSGFPRQSLPQFKDPRSFAHAASAISLLQSMFLGSRNGAVTYR